MQTVHSFVIFLQKNHFLAFIGIIAEYSAIFKNNYAFIINVRKERISIISYEPLWITLKKKNITQYELIKKYHFSTGTLDALRKNRSITLNTLHDICDMLNCKITDVVEFVPEHKEKT